MALMNNSTFQLALCELHYKPIHGPRNTSVDGQYMIIETFDDYDAIFLENDYYKAGLNGTVAFHNSRYKSYVNNYNIKHPIIRNYLNIVSNNYIKPEIIKYFEFDTGERVAILKTFWLRIFQRIVRKWLKTKL